MILAPLTTAGAAYRVTPFPATAFWNRPAERERRDRARDQQAGVDE